MQLFCVTLLYFCHFNLAKPDEQFFGWLGIRILVVFITLAFLSQQVYVIGLGVSIVKKRKSVVDEELDSSDYDSDEELVSA